MKMMADRRVIPFLGAGFSSSHALPGWDELLRAIADDLRITETEPRLTYDELESFGDGDFLRIAEYLFLRAGRSIGPLRYSMTNALHTDLDPLTSTPHVELVNLGCPQVYTTNFDEVIETTYRRLNQPAEVVALSRDVARADSNQTQIVKYHGDLRHDPTLVVTESQYWKRLDFESPMDLKFRSDLLGRSVLFIGYSFRDINIRVIWFKLMQMMRDVPVADRLPSYMVRFEPNPVLEALYDEVGLQTISLDPSGAATTSEQRTVLLSEFLWTLANEASPSGLIAGTGSRMFASDGLLLRVEEEFSSPGVFDPRVGSPVLTLLNRQLDPAMSDRGKVLIEKMMNETARLGWPTTALAAPLAVWTIQWAPSEITTRAVVRALISFNREKLLGVPDYQWRDIWAEKITPEEAGQIMPFAEQELRAHEQSRYFDWDLAFAFDLLVRIANGSLVEADSSDLSAQATELIERVEALYPEAGGYSPPSDGPPHLQALLEAINRRQAAHEEQDGDAETEEVS